jgi:NitT/TauT family transport system permease protein
MEHFFRSLFRGKTRSPEEKPTTPLAKLTPLHPLIHQLKKTPRWFKWVKRQKIYDLVLSKISWIMFILFFSWISAKIWVFLQPLTWADLRIIAASTGITFARVIFTLIISTLWTVPFGLWVGLSAERTKFFQPIIQVMASFPAPMLYPIVLAILYFFGIGIGLGSSILMLLGVQWYVLFNVLAGTTMISRELQDTFKIVGVSKKDTWKSLYLPSIFPSLVTGWVTAAGGAWNASIVAEYIQYKGQTLKATGLGALISDATAHANYSLLAGSLISMVIVVVGFNRLVWHKLYQLVERRFKFER